MWSRIAARYRLARRFELKPAGAGPGDRRTFAAVVRQQIAPPGVGLSTACTTVWPSRKVLGWARSGDVQELTLVEYRTAALEFG